MVRVTALQRTLHPQLQDEILRWIINTTLRKIRFNSDMVILEEEFDLKQERKWQAME
jgi:hypothetical protein